MKKLALSLLLCFAFVQLAAAEDAWLTDLPQALAQAKKEKKHLLLDFTGSDWCPPCKQLKKEVLSSKEFMEYAKQNLVLVELDFPNAKPQAPALKAANEKLSEKFKIEGYPTTIILNADGKELSRSVGYGGETVKDFIAKVNKAVKK